MLSSSKFLDPVLLAILQVKDSVDDNALPPTILNTLVPKLTAFLCPGTNFVDEFPGTSLILSLDLEVALLFRLELLGLGSI